MAIVYGLKVNLSVAMVAMLNHTAIQHSSSLNHRLPLGNISTTTSTLVDACSENSKAEAPEVRILNHQNEKRFYVLHHLVHIGFNVETLFIEAIL